jgi:N-acetyl-gamma-glutamyl-phosphate reductase
MKILLNSALLVLLSGATVSAFAPAALRTAQYSTVLYAKKKIFIDGEAGTTGLQVRGRIEARDDLEIISAPDELRKDEATRKKLINEADAVILCKYND